MNKELRPKRLLNTSYSLIKDGTPLRISIDIVIPPYDERITITDKAVFKEGGQLKIEMGLEDVLQTILRYRKVVQREEFLPSERVLMGGESKLKSKAKSAPPLLPARKESKVRRVTVSAPAGAKVVLSAAAEERAKSLREAIRNGPVVKKKKLVTRAEESAIVTPEVTERTPKLSLEQMGISFGSSSSNSADISKYQECLDRVKELKEGNSRRFD